MKEGSVNFFNEDIKYELKRKRLLRSWIRRTVEMEGGAVGVINIIFCTDKHLLVYNRQYLKHNTLTDIITFQMSDEPGDVSGDIYISIERIRENSKTFNVRMHHEVERVIIHGVLHLLGYKDKSKDEIIQMREKEDLYLGILKGLN